MEYKMKDREGVIDLLVDVNVEQFTSDPEALESFIRDGHFTGINGYSDEELVHELIVLGITESALNMGLITYEI